jgi:hypothetical protein
VAVGRLTGQRPMYALVCQECHVFSNGRAAGWRGYRVDDPDDQTEPPTLAFYCPSCAEREFGPFGLVEETAENEH